MRRLSAGGWLLDPGELHPPDAAAWRVVRERWKNDVPRMETATVHVWRDDRGYYGRESGPICPQGRSAVQAVLRVAGHGVTEVIPPGQLTRAEMRERARPLVGQNVSTEVTLGGIRYSVVGTVSMRVEW